ncbi:MAG: 3-oxoacyl-[acyl-carrier-protein] synthase-1 [Rickettsiales bacterium]|jgi:3-oxoacyl-[acyl-carrier-protein] synthase-1
MRKQIFLSALGMVNSLGNSKSEIFDNLILGKAKSIKDRDDLVLGETLKFGTVEANLPEIPAPFEEYKTRCNQILLASYFQIEDETQQAIKKYGKNRVAVIIGSSTSGIDDEKKSLENHLKQENTHPNFDYSFLEMGHPAKFMAKYLGLENIFYSISTACSSSAKALLSAQNLLNLGLCDAVLVGGSDILCQLVARGFYSMGAESKNGCNPFSKNRDGIMLGEGSALFLMTREPSKISLLGVGESSDAHHTTAPDPTGKGAASAMKQALEKSGLKPQDIDYVNLHGTGTKFNDSMESLAVNSLFPQTLCSSTKPLTGHNLGSAGIIEIGLCWLLLSDLNKNNQLPPHIWDEAIDPDLAPLNLVKNNCKLDTEKLSIRKLSVCLSNSFAFGGSNASVIIGKI